jgi:phosphoribosyl-ATP pyrophosphohydrolase/phosphoribosyl-AMP cyclohydrolase
MKEKINDSNSINFEDRIEDNIEIVPAVIQDYKTGEVLMLAYMNRESIKRSIETKTTWFWSRSRKKLWNKGETSGNRQIIKEMKYDCDADTILVRVEQIGNACHTGARSCFFNEIDLSDIKSEELVGKLRYQKYFSGKSEILRELQGVLEERIKQKSVDSYTYRLHKKGLEEILKKIGEEVIEVIISAEYEKKERLVYEISDLLYHLLVLMVEKKISIDAVYSELKSRRKKGAR